VTFPGSLHRPVQGHAGGPGFPHGLGRPAARDYSSSLHTYGCGGRNCWCAVNGVDEPRPPDGRAGGRVHLFVPRAGVGRRADRGGCWWCGWRVERRTRAETRQTASVLERRYARNWRTAHHIRIFAVRTFALHFIRGAGGLGDTLCWHLATKATFMVTLRADDACARRALTAMSRTWGRRAGERGFYILRLPLLCETVVVWQWWWLTGGSGFYGVRWDCGTVVWQREPGRILTTCSREWV